MPRPIARGTASNKSAIEWVRERMADPANREEIDALMTEMSVEQDLLALREERGLTQGQLAQRVGVSQPVIARLEGGRIKNVELRTLTRLAAALGARVKITFEKDEQAAAAKHKARRKRRAA